MPFTQITRAQLRAQVYARLGQSTFWRDDEVNRYIQEALRVWNALTGYWKTRDATTKTTVGEHWYTVPSVVTSGMRVLWNGKPLYYSSLWDLDNGRYQWESETTTTGGDVPTTPVLWTPAGLKLIAIWPGDAVAQNSIVFDGISKTPILTSDGSYIDIGSEELVSLLDYIEHIAIFKEGGKEFAASIPLQQAFIKGAMEKNAMLMASAHFRKWLGMQKDDAQKPRYQRPERAGAR